MCVLHKKTGNGLTATARIGWPSDPGILFASAHAWAISAPAKQERREVYQTRLDKGGFLRPKEGLISLGEGGFLRPKEGLTSLG